MGSADHRKLSEAKCLLFDMDGTLYLGDRLLPGVHEMIALLNEWRIPHYFVTNNSSLSREDYVRKLHGLGLEVPEETIFSSGEAAALYLRKRQPGARLYLVGTPSLEAEFAGYGFQLVQDTPDYTVLGFDTTLTYEKLWKLCDFVRAGVPYIATHPDANCPTETGFMPDIGATIAFVAASTGREPDVIVGKPYAPIVEAITEKIGFGPAQIVMVGDRLYTDIALGQAGLTTVLVLSGETKPADLADSPYRPDFIVENVRELYNIFQTFELGEWNRRLFRKRGEQDA